MISLCRRLGNSPIYLALLLLLWLVAPPATAASRWLEITSDDYVLITNLPEAKARALLRDFEVFQFAVEHILPGADIRPRVPTYLLALGSADFSAVSAGRDVAGLFSGADFANYIVYEHGRKDTRAREVIFHEYIHFILHNTSGVVYPAWYNEGLADVLSTLEEDEGKFHLGKAPKHHLYTIAYTGLLPTEQVLEIDYRSPDFREHKLLPQFYAQAWLMTHYLMIGNAERTEQVKRYVGEINRGASTAAAVRTAFDVTPAQLHDELARYSKSRKMLTWRFEFTDPLPTVDRVPLRVLGDAQAQAMLAHATLRMSREPQRAWRFVERALKHDPANPLACAAAAWVKDLEGSTHEADAFLERALTQPEATQAQLLAAQLLLMRAQQGLEHDPADTESRARALRARDLHEALLFNPVAKNQAAYGYAQAALLLGEPETSEVLAVVRRATQRLPSSTKLAGVEATLSARVGDYSAAAAAASRGARYASSFEEREAMLKMLAGIDEQNNDEAAKPAGK